MPECGYAYAMHMQEYSFHILLHMNMNVKCTDVSGWELGMGIRNSSIVKMWLGM